MGVVQQRRTVDELDHPAPLQGHGVRLEQAAVLRHDDGPPAAATSPTPRASARPVTGSTAGKRSRFRGIIATSWASRGHAATRASARSSRRARAVGGIVQQDRSRRAGAGPSVQPAGRRGAGATRGTGSTSCQQALGVTGQVGKQGQRLCLWTPPKAEPLESLCLRKGCPEASGLWRVRAKDGPGPAAPEGRWPGAAGTTGGGARASRPGSCARPPPPVLLCRGRETGAWFGSTGW